MSKEVVYKIFVIFVTVLAWFFLPLTLPFPGEFLKLSHDAQMLSYFMLGYVQTVIIYQALDHLGYLLFD